MREAKTSKPSTKKSANHALPKNIRNQMENSFGADFSNINIHTDSQEADSMDALAFTKGNDVHFGKGQFSPLSRQGQSLIGHEFSHVLQQRSGRVQPQIQQKNHTLNQDPQLEAEADRAGELASLGQKVHIAGADAGSNVVSSPVVQKKEKYKAKLSEEEKTNLTLDVREQFIKSISEEDSISEEIVTNANSAANKLVDLIRLGNNIYSQDNNESEMKLVREKILLILELWGDTVERRGLLLRSYRDLEIRSLDPMQEYGHTHLEAEANLLKENLLKIFTDDEEMKFRMEAMVTSGSISLADKIYIAIRNGGTDEESLYRLLKYANEDFDNVERELVEKKYDVGYTGDYLLKGETMPANEKDTVGINRSGRFSWLVGIISGEMGGNFFNYGESQKVKAMALLTFGNIRPIDKIACGVLGTGTDNDLLFQGLGEAYDFYKTKKGLIGTQPIGSETSATQPPKDYSKSIKELISEEYQTTHNRTLVDDIKGDTSWYDETRGLGILDNGDGFLTKIDYATSGMNYDEAMILSATKDLVETDDLTENLFLATSDGLEEMEEPKAEEPKTEEEKQKESSETLRKQMDVNFKALEKIATIACVAPGTARYGEIYSCLSWEELNVFMEILTTVKTQQLTKILNSLDVDLKAVTLDDVNWYLQQSLLFINQYSLQTAEVHPDVKAFLTNATGESIFAMMTKKIDDCRNRVVLEVEYQKEIKLKNEKITEVRDFSHKDLEGIEAYSRDKTVTSKRMKIEGFSKSMSIEEYEKASALVSKSNNSEKIVQQLNDTKKLAKHKEDQETYKKEEKNPKKDKKKAKKEEKKAPKLDEEVFARSAMQLLYVDIADKAGDYFKALIFCDRKQYYIYRKLYQGDTPQAKELKEHLNAKYSSTKNKTIETAFLQVNPIDRIRQTTSYTFDDDEEYLYHIVSKHMTDDQRRQLANDDSMLKEIKYYLSHSEYAKLLSLLRVKDKGSRDERLRDQLQVTKYETVGGAAGQTYTHAQLKDENRSAKAEYYRQYYKPKDKDGKSALDTDASKALDKKLERSEDALDSFITDRDAYEALVMTFVEIAITIAFAALTAGTGTLLTQSLGALIRQTAIEVGFGVAAKAIAEKALKGDRYSSKEFGKVVLNETIGAVFDVVTKVKMFKTGVSMDEFVDFKILRLREGDLNIVEHFYKELAKQPIGALKESFQEGFEQDYAKKLVGKYESFDTYTGTLKGFVLDKVKAKTKIISYNAYHIIFRTGKNKATIKAMFDGHKHEIIGHGWQDSSKESGYELHNANASHPSVEFDEKSKVYIYKNVKYTPSKEDVSKLNREIKKDRGIVDVVEKEKNKAIPNKLAPYYAPSKLNGGKNPYIQPGNFKEDVFSKEALIKIKSIDELDILIHRTETAHRFALQHEIAKLPVGFYWDFEGNQLVARKYSNEDFQKSLTVKRILLTNTAEKEQHHTEKKQTEKQKAIETQRKLKEKEAEEMQKKADKEKLRKEIIEKNKAEKEKYLTEKAEKDKSKDLVREGHLKKMEEQKKQRTAEEKALQMQKMEQYRNFEHERLITAADYARKIGKEKLDSGYYWDFDDKFQLVIRKYTGEEIENNLIDGTAINNNPKEEKVIVQKDKNDAERKTRSPLNNDVKSKSPIEINVQQEAKASGLGEPPIGHKWIKINDDIFNVVNTGELNLPIPRITYDGNTKEYIMDNQRYKSVNLLNSYLRRTYNIDWM